MVLFNAEDQRWLEHLMKIDDNRNTFLLFLHKNLCCGYSLESPCRGDSNEYPQHRFL